MSGPYRIAFLLLSLAATNLLTRAQTSLGTITGTVTDQTGSPV